MSFERFHVQCLREDLRVLLFGAHVLYIHYPAFDCVANDVVLDVHVPRPLAAEAIFCHLDHSLVVLVDLELSTSLGGSSHDCVTTLRTN